MAALGVMMMMLKDQVAEQGMWPVLQRVAELEALCKEFDTPIGAAALQFPLAHSAVDIVMLGARSVPEWEDGLAVMGHVIPPAFWQALRDAGLLPLEAPTP